MERISNRIGIPGAVESLIGGRDENQDDFGFAETQLGLLVVVCDGMGGGPAGRTASSLARETIIRQLSGAKITDNPEAVLYNAVVAANNALLGAIAAKPDLQGMGTTCVCLLVNRKYAYIAHVGDSRCYQLRRGQTVFRTADHSYVGELVRRNTISEEEARQSKYSNVITRAIGVGQTIEPEIDKVTVRPGDRFALMSDGIWGSMPEHQLVEDLSHPGDLNTIVPALALKVDQIGIKEGGGHDNLTLAMVQLPDTPQPQPAQPRPAKPPVRPKNDAGKDKVNAQVPSDSDLHITITELSDEGATRRKNIWIWILSVLLVAVIGVMAWLLLHNKDNDSADDKSRYVTVDNRSKTVKDEYTMLEGLENQGHSTQKNTATQHNSAKDAGVTQIIEKAKEKQDPTTDTEGQDDTGLKRNTNMTEKQQIIYQCAADLRNMIVKYHHAPVVKKSDNSREWKARKDAIQRILKNISKKAKKALTVGDNSDNAALRNLIEKIDNVAGSSGLIDSDYGRPSGDTEKILKDVAAKLEKMSGAR